MYLHIPQFVHLENNAKKKKASPAWKVARITNLIVYLSFNKSASLLLFTGVY